MRTAARGQVGWLYAGPRVAAKLGPWSISVKDEAFQGSGWRLQAVLTFLDSFWLEHARPFTLELQMGPSIWRWRNVDAEPETGVLVIDGEGEPEVINGTG